MEHANPAVVLLMLLFVGPTLYFILFRKKTADTIHIRRLPGVDALDEAIGRAVELGRPISFTFGLLNVGPTLYACLGVLRHVAKKAATFGSRLLVPCNDPEVLALTDVTLQGAYRSVGRLSRYDPSSAIFLSAEQFAFASGYMGLLHREQVASAFLFGQFAAESLILAETGQQIGAMQVAATTSNEQIPFFITSCDYTLIGEELFAAGAFLSSDGVLRSSLRGQDISKLCLLLIVLLGVAQASYSAVIGATTEPIGLIRLISISWSDLFQLNVGGAP